MYFWLMSSEVSVPACLVPRQRGTVEETCLTLGIWGAESMETAQENWVRDQVWFLLPCPWEPLSSTRLYPPIAHLAIRVNPCMKLVP